VLLRSPSWAWTSSSVSHSQAPSASVRPLIVETQVIHAYQTVGKITVLYFRVYVWGSNQGGKGFWTEWYQARHAFNLLPGIIQSFKATAFVMWPAILQPKDSSHVRKQAHYCLSFACKQALAPACNKWASFLSNSISFYFILWPVICCLSIHHLQ
jgi:hypothetical protein